VTAATEEQSEAEKPAAPQKTWEDWSRENDKLPGMYPSPQPAPVPIDKGDLS
jgi:hypothetical protein